MTQHESGVAAGKAVFESVKLMQLALTDEAYLAMLVQLDSMVRGQRLFIENCGQKLIQLPLVGE